VRQEQIGLVRRLFGLSPRFIVYDVLAAGLERTGRETT